MAFVFSLKALLRVREIREIRALQALQMIVSQAAAAQAEIEALDTSMEETRRETCTGSLAGVSGAELHFQVLRDSAYRERRQTLLEKLNQLKKIQQKQTAVYRQARQQREVLSSLREEQLAAYNLDEGRREQRRIDEFYLLRNATGHDETKSR